MKSTWSCEMSVDFQRNEMHYIPEDRTVHNHSCETLKFYKRKTACKFSVQSDSTKEWEFTGKYIIILFQDHFWKCIRSSFISAPQMKHVLSPLTSVAQMSRSDEAVSLKTLLTWLKHKLQCDIRIIFQIWLHNSVNHRNWCSRHRQFGNSYLPAK
jgi:hypothetical protein